MMQQAKAAPPAGPQSLADMMAEARKKKEEPSLGQRLGMDRWRDVGRGLTNTAAGLLTAPGEGLARVAGEILPDNFGGRASREAADQLKAQREGVAQAVGPYETGTGAAAQIVGNLATAVVGGDPLQTAAAASSRDASTLALAGDLMKRWSTKGSTVDQIADEVVRLSNSPAARGAVEYAIGRLTAGVANKVMAKVRQKVTKAGLAADGPLTQRAPQVETDPARILTDGNQPTPLPQMPDGGPVGQAMPMRGITVGEPGPVTGPAILSKGEIAPPDPNALQVITSSGKGRQTIGEISSAADRAARAERSALKKLMSAAKKPKRGSLTDPGRANVFPGPEALASLATKPAATAGIGATIGAVNDDEDRVRGAIIGAAGGYAVGISLRGISQYRAMRAMEKAPPSLANASPEARAAYGIVTSGIDHTGELEDLARARAKGPFLKRLQQLYDKAGDAARPLERLGAKAEAAGLDFDRTPTAALNHALDVGSTEHRFFFDKAIDPATGQAVGPSFRDLHEPLAGNPGAIKDAWTYVVAKRIADRGVEAFSGDATTFQAYADMVGHLGQNADNVAFANRLNEYVDALGRYGVGSGLWTPTEWSAMRASDEIYVPFRSVEAKIQREMGLSGKGGGRGGSLNPSGIKGRYGNPDAADVIANPAKSLAEYTKQVIRRADQARINRSLFAAADAMGLEGEAILTTLPDGDPRLFHAQNATSALEAAGMTPAEAGAKATLYVDKLSGVNDIIEAVDEAGVRRYAMLNALSALRETPYTASPEVMRILVIPRRIVTATTTGLAPRFALMKNPLMDIPDVAARVPGIRPSDYAKGYASSLRQSMYTHLQEIMPKLADAIGPSKTADEASRAGLSNTSLFQRDLSPQSVADQLAPMSAGRAAWGSVKQAVHEPLLMAESVGAAMDMGPRLAAYNAVRRQLIKEGAHITSASAKAASVGARSAVDYRRSSSLNALQFLYAVTPFLKASVLATQRFASFAKQYPARAATLASGAATLGMIDWAVNGGDALMRDRATTERMQGPEFRLASGDVVQLPMSPELNLFRTSMYWALNKMMGDDPNAGKLVRESILRALPPGIGEFAATGRLASFAPPGAQQLLENEANRTVFGDRPVVPGQLEGRSPEFQKYPSTPATYDAIAAGLRKLGIAPQVNALEVENVLSSMTNGFTPAVLSLTDPIAERVMGASAEKRVPPPSITSSLNPFSAVLKRKVPTRTESETEFYDIRSVLTTKYNDLSALVREAKQAPPGPQRVAKIQQLEAFIQENAPYLSDEVQKLPTLVGAAMKEFREAEAAVQAQFGAKAIDKKEANDLLDALRLQRQDMLRRSTEALRARLPQ